MMLEHLFAAKHDKYEEKDTAKHYREGRINLIEDSEDAQTDDSILGMEMMNVCLEHPDKAVAFSLLFSFSIAEFDKANGINSEISNRLLEIKELLGEDLCIWYSKNYKGLKCLISILKSYVDTYENAKKNKDEVNELNQLIKSLPCNNYEAKITPLISAFGAKDETSGLAELFERAKIFYVRDLLSIVTLTIDKKHILQIIRIVKWLSEDKKALLKAELHNLSKNDRDEEILRKRAKGATLEQTSEAYALTHEGVRQIEKKFQGRFDRYITGTMPHYILYAFSKNSGYISLNDITELLGSLSDIFIYSLKKSNCATAHWSVELNGFIIGDGKWYEQLIEFKKGLPEILDSGSVDELIANLIDNLSLPLSFDDARRLVLVEYILIGNIYLKKRVSLSRMYYAVLEKYYPDGIKLYDDSESIRFRNYVRELFGDVHLPENNRAIDVRLTELTILCDKGKRILPSGIKIPIELLRIIYEAIIEVDRNVISFQDLFQRFKNELLENSNITNKYFLQGVLRHNYSKEFDFTRYTLKKRVKLFAASNQISPEMWQELPTCLKT